MTKLFNYLFLIIGTLTILEYTFICGIFTGVLMMILSIIIGFINIIISLKEKNKDLALLYLISTIALSMGYIKLII